MSFIDQVIARYAPTKPTFEVTLPGGEVLQFRHFKDVEDFDMWTASAVDFANQATAGFKGPMKEFKFATAGPAVEAHLISYLSVEPKISQLDALRLTKAPSLFKYIVGEIEKARRQVNAAEAEEKIEQKKDSSNKTQPVEPS